MIDTNGKTYGQARYTIDHERPVEYNNETIIFTRDISKVKKEDDLDELHKNSSL